MQVAGQYLHFRCDKHETAGFEPIPNAFPSYRCEVPDCDRPAKAYWYRGEQFATLKMTPTTYSEWLTSYRCKSIT